MPSRACLVDLHLVPNSVSLERKYQLRCAMETHSHLHLRRLDQAEPRPVGRFLELVNHEAGNVPETLLLLEALNQLRVRKGGQFGVELPVRIDLNIRKFQIKREFEVGAGPEAIGSIDGLGLQGCYYCL